MRPSIFIAVVVWGLLILGGFVLLSEHEFAPGDPASPPQDWPSASRIARAADRPTLVVFAHPHCPCTRATINELARIVADDSERLYVAILFLSPSEFDETWVQSDLWTSAKTIPRAVVMKDSDGREAGLFRAVTSGQTVLYDTNGKLRFVGGITGTRGHEGQNAGRAAIVEMVKGRVSPTIRTPVFGCPLIDPTIAGKREGNECKS